MTEQEIAIQNVLKALNELDQALNSLSDKEAALLASLLQKRPKKITVTHKIELDGSATNYTQREADIATRLWNIYEAADLAEKAERRALLATAAKIKLELEKVIKIRKLFDPNPKRIPGGIQSQ